MTGIFTPKKLLFILMSAVLVAFLMWPGVTTYADGNAESSGLGGFSFERLPNGGIGPKIPNVRLTFLEVDGNHAYSIFTNEYGYYKIDLPVGRYYAAATHPDFYTYYTDPGWIVVTGGGHQTANFFLIRK